MEKSTLTESRELTERYVHFEKPCSYLLRSVPWLILRVTQLAVLLFTDLFSDETWNALLLPDTSATSSTGEFPSEFITCMVPTPSACDTVFIPTYAAIATVGTSIAASELPVSTTAYDTVSIASYAPTTAKGASSTASVLSISTTALVLVPFATAAANHTASEEYAFNKYDTSSMIPANQPKLEQRHNTILAVFRYLSATKIDSYLLVVVSEFVLLVVNLMTYFLWAYPFID